MTKIKSFYQNYLNEICKTYHQESTEASYYPALKKFLEDYLSEEKNQTNILIQPKKTEVGIPDFILKTKEGKITGYIEAKEPDKNVYSLSKTDTEQIERYNIALPNLILTNFIDFVLFRNGQKIKEVRIAQPVTLKLKNPIPQKIDELNDLLYTFFDFSIPQITTAENLAQELAKRTKLLTHYVLEELKTNPQSSVHNFFKAFQEELIPSLDLEHFADMYSQTISYGLFSARIRAKENSFSRLNAYQYIPSTIPLLRTLFHYITGPDLPESLEWIIDDITDVLSSTDISSILKDFHTTKWTDDPVIHFYETFLEVYNPKEREKRGVYYTPAPVVSYIVRSIHELLKLEFNKKDGLADKSVTLLDPAAGTLTFPAAAIRLAKQELEDKGKAGVFTQLVKEHILKNFYAFELMVAPYAIGHFKISIALEDLGYKLGKNERFNLYLTNTLEVKDIKQVDLPLISDLAKEGIAAKEVKDKIPILVITGNPPYSVSSENKSEFIEGLMETYKEDVKGERNIQPLSDDYIKFLRFAQWKIEQGGLGVVGMITNNSYLSGLIHRGMRKKLLESFDKIYILNLHGNARIGEKCPDDSKDENVFDIMQGVTIALFVKSSKHNVAQGFSLAEKKVYYADLWGVRDEGTKNKYKYLAEHDITNTKWQKLEPKEPHYFFVPKEFAYEEKYQKFWSVKVFFTKYKQATLTKRDEFLVDINRQSLKARILILLNPKTSDTEITELYGLKDTYEWELSSSRETAIKNGFDEEKLIKYVYRPFDFRYIYYEDALIARSVREIMTHMLKSNIALALIKQIYEEEFNHVFVTNSVSDLHLFSGSGQYVFPLYLYPEEKTKKGINPGKIMMLFDQQEKYQTKIPNLNQEFVKKLELTYKKKILPEEIFYYIYAVLYSNVYRKKYEEFLKIDFPKVPFISDYKLFQRFAKFGKDLVLLHLLKSSVLDSPDARYPVQGSDKVEKVIYKENKKRVYINTQQYFEDIPKEIWEYYIGGYQVLAKWLKERKDRKLSLDEIEHYLKVITAIKHTIKLQKEIDKLYPEVEKELITV